MSDKTLFGCAETGTYSTDAPNPHIDLSGSASTDYSIAQLFAEAMSSDETATVSIIKDRDNWAVYGGAKFTNDTVDTLDLSVATLLESKGTLSDEDAVTCLGLAPGTKGTSYTKVRRNAALTSPDNSTQKLEFDTAEIDADGAWDSANKRFNPKKPGYYLITARFELNSGTYCILSALKNGADASYMGATVNANCEGIGGSCVMYCNGSTDYIEIYFYTASAISVSVAGSSRTYAEIVGPL